MYILRHTIKNIKYNQTFLLPLDHGFRKVSLLNDYSLDAPLVAIVWQFVLARWISADLGFYHHLILGASVWLAYSADRFSEPNLTTFGKARRHAIFRHHQFTFLCFWATAFLVVLYFSLLYLEVVCLLCGLPLFGLCVGNFLLCRMESRIGFASKCSKEFRTAFIFSLGCILFPFQESSLGFAEFAWFWLFSFSLFLINCICVSEWEWSEDEKRGCLTWLQSKPVLLKTLANGKYLLALLAGIGILIDGLERSLFIYAFFVSVFVILIDSCLSDNQDKREAIDLGYWVLPFAMVGFEYVLRI